MENFSEENRDNNFSENLAELYNKRRILADQILKYFHGGNVNEKNKGYQKLLREVDEISEQINDFNDLN